MPVNKLKKYLDSEHIKYKRIIHSKAYTAQEIASSAHISGKELAKSVMVKVDGKISMTVLPASYHVDLDKLKKGIGAKNVELAHEFEFKDKFPDCEVGAMPPFGNLYGIDVYVAEKLTEDDEIAFNACSHTELFKMKYKEYANLVKPKVLKISYGV